jgi:hypothetical protein
MKEEAKVVAKEGSNLSPSVALAKEGSYLHLFVP